MVGLIAHFKLIGRQFADGMRVKNDPDAYPNRAPSQVELLRKSPFGPLAGPGLSSNRYTLQSLSICLGVTRDRNR